MKIFCYRWAAPEQLQERPFVSKAIDIFAFGVIMWELLARRMPYSGQSVGAIVTGKLSGKREEIPSDCPAAFAGIIERCWAQEHLDRPTAAQIAEELMHMEVEVP